MNDAPVECAVMRDREAAALAGVGILSGLNKLVSSSHFVIHFCIAFRLGYGAILIPLKAPVNNYFHLSAFFFWFVLCNYCATMLVKFITSWSL